MRTTLNIDDELLKEAKIAAIREGITLTEYIERGLRHIRGCAQSADESVGERTERRWEPISFPGEPLPDFPWSGSFSTILEYVEGPDARP